MLKKITKVLTTAGLLISLISAEVSPGAVYAENGAPITAEASETTGIAETPEAKASAVETDFVDNEALVTGIIVNTISDGTGNFDENDEPGNDSNINNRIVRTFDTVRYAVEYTINMRKGSEYTTFEKAYVNVEMSIPGSKGDVEFITGDMPWLEDAKTSYENGRITLTGRTLIKQNKGVNPIPGAHGFNVVMRAMGLNNGTVLRPQIKLWLDGNAEEEHKAIVCDENSYTMDGQNCAVTVSASSRLDIMAVSGSGITARYADLTSNTIGTDASYGKLGIMGNMEYVIMLHGASANKGVMGVELPDGDITFDMTLNSTYKERHQDTVTNPNPTELWDYTQLDQPATGMLGRRMNYYNLSCYLANIPHKGTDTQGIESPGTNKVEKIGENKYRITVSNYEITSHFPVGNNWSEGKVFYQDNEGCFTGGKIQFYTEIPEKINDITDYWVSSTIDNISYTSKSGTVFTEETRTDNNKAVNGFTRYPKGNFSKKVLAVSYNSAFTMGNPWHAGNVIKSIDDKIGFSSGIDTAAGNDISTSLYAVDHLIKFDDRAFTPLSTYYQRYEQYENNVKPKIKLVYGTKKDGTGWADEDELQKTRIGELDFYESLEEINKLGKKCVAVLAEEREGVYTPGTCYDYSSIAPNFSINSDTEVNNVYIATTDVYGYFKSSAKGWTIDNSSITDIGFADPDVTLETWGDPYPKYYKSQFDENGGFIADHSACDRGASVYVIGETNSITKGFDQVTNTSGGSAVEKKNYNLNFNERQVDYYIQPKVSSIANEPKSTAVTVVDVLPKHIAYIPNSSVLGGTYNQPTSTESSSVSGGESLEPKVEYNEATGETTLTWVIKNVTPNTDIGKIHYSCSIGDVSDPSNDVDEEDNPLTTKTVMYSSYGQKTDAIQTSLNVIKSISASLSKTVDNKYIERNGDINYRLSFSNSSENNTRPFYLFDVLPFTGDSRKSDYNGTLSVKTIRINKSHAAETITKNIKLYYTKDESLRTANTSDAKVLKDQQYNWIEVPCVETKDALTYTVNQEATGIRVTGDTLVAMEALTINVNCGTKGNKGKDCYVNSTSVYADRFADTVFSSNVNTKVIKRNISGIVWNDQTSDGLRQNEEELFSDISVKLYRTTPSAYDNTKKPVKLNTKDGEATLYEAYNTDGKKLDAVKTDSNGYYKFDNLEAGTYFIDFSDISTALNITKKNAGNDKTIDSDGEAVLNRNNTIERAYIKEVVLPEASTMTYYLYESTHNDVGLSYRLGSITVSKTVAGTIGDKTKDFTFQLKMTGNIPAEIPYTKGAKTGTLKVTDGAAEFTLSHGENIVLSKIQIGTAYEITEVDGASNGYTVESTNSSGTLTEDTNVSFTNTRNGTVPTSAHTNILVSIGVFATALAGLFWYLRKRKQ